ncbi:phage antirepressor [Dietzia sp. PP-33]|uniref:phage antirepressor n=1 Tax=Dietzia sp. PP-33 TaxID=2957500 RepID=UPI0029A664AC|nr:phage antirepressor KilAC domain-containing protein [Dietzia sp. PP-33]MDX2357446.1 phage antirepressor [Dietzia sp. PP-33]
MADHTGALVPFQYGDAQVRVVTIESEPWFVLADLCRVLEIRNARDVSGRLDEDMKGVDQIDTPGGRQSVTVVSEAGMYEVVIRSDNPEAAAFRRWITSEVLPSIRKHGGYLTEAKVEAVLSNPDTIIRLATDLKAERARRAELEAQREFDAPKVLFADAVSASKSNILVGELAKVLKGNGIDIGANRLFEVLRSRGYLISRKGTDWNMPTQKSMELGLFRIKETTVVHSDGHTSLNKTPKVTGKGQQYFVERFLDGRLVAVAS